MTRKINLLEQIASYTVNLQYNDIPSDAIELAKWIVFDSIATGLGGYQNPLGQKSINYGRHMMPGNAATLLGDGGRSSLEGAAFINGVMIKILGMDDSHRSAGHIASQVMPALFAVAEAYNTSGEEILIAIIAAYDFAVRVASQVRTFQRERGLDLKGTVGSMAAALAVSKCAGFDVEKTSHAIALAADLSSGTEQYVYEGGKCDTKDLIAGFGARNGVFAMRLAEAGFYGPQGALDGPYGFFQAFGDGYEEGLFDDLGKYFAIMGTAFKPHGGCRHTHQAIDAVQDILKQGPIDLNAIEAVTLETYGYATRPIFRVDPNPPSRDVAGLSIRVSTAIALARGQAYPQDFEIWDDPEVRRVRQLIDVQVDPEIEARYPELNGCRLHVSLNNGETRNVYLPHMKGEPEFRMSTDELREKFYMLTKDLFSVKRVDNIYTLCTQLEQAQNIHALMALTSTTLSETELIEQA